MKKILVAYATNSGSTEEVAELIGKTLANKKIGVDILKLDAVQDLDSYDGVIIGAPMIMGWHRSAMRFVKSHLILSPGKPVAFFLTAMNLTETRETSIDGVTIQVDPGLACAPQNPRKLSFKERYALPANYVHPILRAADRVKPVSIGLFGGSLNLFALDWFERIFVLLVIQAKPGDLRNEPFIKNWAGEIRKKFIDAWLK